jgi:hypothetical protein
MGKFAKPRCFKNVRALLCMYTNNSKCMDDIRNFLASLDAKVSAMKRNILLFTHKCLPILQIQPSYVILRWCFFPPN